MAWVAYPPGSSPGPLAAGWKHMHTSRLRNYESTAKVLGFQEYTGIGCQAGLQIVKESVSDGARREYQSHLFQRRQY
ncbi:hypothetical protein Trco_001939 [Trichoderma cornu-damae]|uniref:Uncharacterized protein n=1 Tax=Trichoderma cornu-damae TaxID=654480 RepID=A0A9P8QTQ2_9HYPO|nr:hypothetical protein Trco_001939 [Trichoderma cornu-damae]